MNILYIHGMGGGADSRIPSILNEHLGKSLPGANVVVRTYSFDPVVGASQIAAWYDELRPKLVIGESLGCLHAMRLSGVPHILVSPALGAGYWFGYLAPFYRIPGIPALLGHKYKPKNEERQPMVFTYNIMRKYKPHLLSARANTPAYGSKDTYLAFFGTRDHFRRSGVVSLRLYRKWFGDSYSIYEGTHFMEEEYIHSMLIPAIADMISGNYC